jgi:peptide/nickel transport system permease protein
VARANNRTRALLLFALSAALLIAVTIAGTLLHDAATQTNLAARNLAPSLAHLFGTDFLGRDMLTRTLAGLALSVQVGFIAAVSSSIIAVLLGLVAALGGRKADAAVSWLIDLLLGFPQVLILLLISVAVGRGYWGITIGVALTHWPSLARVVRAEVLQIRSARYVATARRLGASWPAIAWRHMVPHVLPHFIVGLVLLFPHAILHEASLTFLGFGLPPEQPAIGVILSEAMRYLAAGNWWLAVFPGLLLLACVLLFNAAGSNLRKATSPASSQE